MPGLTSAEVRARLARYGPNALPEPRAPSVVAVFLRQSLNPLIYVLVAAALVSLALGDIKDALFIGVVLLINGAIGTVQEYSAGRAAAALRRMEAPHAQVIRDGVRQEIDARELAPGDLVLLEAGSRVPADLRLVEAADLQCDESLMTGESAPVNKLAGPADEGGSVDARQAMAYAASVVTRGRGRGIVTATGSATEIGKIAEEIGKRSISQPPLIIRMERFSRMIAIAVGIAVALLVVVGLLRGMGLHDLFMMSVGLAVSAIPEGLPVAISVALAIGMRRMARVHVIIRKMPAVEALGSCTMIATDKTGTLTLNELMVTDICLPDGAALICEAGHDLDACTIRGPHGADQETRERVAALLRAAALPNEAHLVQEAEGWRGTGDTVDVALLAVARKGGVAQEEILGHFPLVGRISYEPDLKYAASFHRREDRICVFVKGAPEVLIAMAERMDFGGQAAPIDRERLLRQKDELAAQGLRVLAFAEGEIEPEPDGKYGHGHLIDLTFLGLAGMQDPIRPEVPRAIEECHGAGIEVAMVTGDDPKTASVIAAQAGLLFLPDQVVTGDQVRRAAEEGEEALDRLTRQARIYARVEPAQKLSIVLSLARNGHFVAVTGDGVNDAPALRHAHVGVAMGRKGTDLAKESADIIITDDNFASIVSGVREGRIAYANIRKVIFLLVSTGTAEVVLFLLAMPVGLPMPLLAVQLLWLNLVTNGIQHVALAAEKAEGDELSYPPRRPSEPIFDRIMLRRIVHSAAVMGAGGFATFYWLLERGYGEDEARNLLLLLFVLFENFQALNARSEHHSMFRGGLFKNRLLVFAVIGAQGLHIAAMHIPGLSDALRVAPVRPAEWGLLLAIAATLLVVMEFEKWWDQRAAARAR
jgi:Ca2+-transporting ATPase